MPLTLTHKVLQSHGVPVHAVPGDPIALRIDQTLTQDATGTMAWLQFEALGVPRVRTDLSVSYVDHNTLQMGFRNADDHRFLRTCAQRFGAVFSPPGTGICHQLHLENFAQPGATLLGSDSHTPTCGGMGSLAIGAGGLSVALAMAGQPYALSMPKVLRVWLMGQLAGWATAKDVILHLLGKLTVKGGVDCVLEYDGPGVNILSVPERATITNMGAELGATASIFPSDERTREFLKAQGRELDWKSLVADKNAKYDAEIVVDLSTLVPLAAAPHMPDKVVPVAELAGIAVDQVAIGSCTNSSYTDMELVAGILGGHVVHSSTDTSIAPGSKQVLALLAQSGLLARLLESGVRLLECACGPCIGMGGAPMSAGISVRTFNRNFEGRSGTRDAQVYLVSPITAAQAALHGQFTDPATWRSGHHASGEGQKEGRKNCDCTPYTPHLPEHFPSIRHLFVMPPKDGYTIEVVRGPNIVALECFAPLDENLIVAVVIKVGDNITTDHIMPAGGEITALRSNVPAIAEYVFSRVDADFVKRARAAQKIAQGGVILAGYNYGQGSSREHAALAPRHLGIRAVIAKSFARIHRANLVNFGIVPLTFAKIEDYERIALDARITIATDALAPGVPLTLGLDDGDGIVVHNDLSTEEWDSIRAGGLLNYSGARCVSSPQK